MIKKLLVAKLVALFGVLAFYNTSLVAPAEAKVLTKCKYVSTGACHKLRHVAKRKAYYKLRAKAKYPYKIKWKRVACKIRKVRGRKIWCCFYKARICRKPVVSKKCKYIKSLSCHKIPRESEMDGL